MSKKILVVEDDNVLADTLSLLLKDGGFDVEVSNSAKQAEKKLKESTPDMIILDILMPDENGFDLLNKWKSSGLVKQIPITVSTNLDNMEHVNRALTLGARNYFLKSDMSSEDIVKHCKQVLGQS